MNGDDFVRLGYLALLLAAIGGWVIVEYRGRMAQALRCLLYTSRWRRPGG